MMIHVRWILLVLLVCTFNDRLEAQTKASPARVEQLSPAEAAAVDTAIERAMQQEGVLGLAIGIIRDREVVYTRGYGFAEPARRRPVTETTSFQWASVSKLLGAVVAMQLVEQGKLDLDAGVHTYVPEFPQNQAVITTRQLLCHQSGIPHYSNGKIIPTPQRYTSARPFDDPVIALDKFARSPLLFEPGAKQSYSSYAYVLLSAVLQRAGDQPFALQVQQRIAEPIGADSLKADVPRSQITNRATGLKKVNGRVVPAEEEDVGWKHAAGGYLSNVGDLARFARGLIRREFVSEQTEAAMWTIQPTSSGEKSTYGLGFVIDNDGRSLKVSHNGRQSNSRTRLVIYPTDGHGMVVMLNSNWADPGKYSTLAYRALASAR